MEKLFDKILDTGYLSAPRYEFYRPIMHFLYEQSIERVGDFVSQREVVEYVRENCFSEYTIKSNHDDLLTLKALNVINIIQDNSRPESMAVYKDAYWLCQITPAGMLVEEYVAKRDEIANAPGGSLEGTAFSNLAYMVRRMDEAIRKDDWEEATTQFTNAYQLFENILTEASKFFQVVNEHAQKTISDKEQLIVFRRTIVSYLENFLEKFGYSRNNIQRMLIATAKHMPLEQIAVKIVSYRINVRGEQVENQEALTISTLSKLERIHSWFGAGAFGKSGTNVNFLYRRIEEAIGVLLKGIAALTDHTRYYAKRVDDYRRAAEWFAGLNDVNDSHKLSAYIFGPVETRYMMSEGRPDNLAEQPLWKMGGMPVEKIAVHDMKPRGLKQMPLIKDKSEEEEAQAAVMLEEHLRRQALLENLFADSVLDLRTIYACTLEELHLIIEIIRDALGHQSAFDESGLLTQHAITHLSTGKTVVVEILSDNPVAIGTECGTYSFCDFRIREVRKVG